MNVRVVCPRDCVVDWGDMASDHCSASGESIYCIYIAGLRKGQNSQFHVQFLLNVHCFCTIMKSRNYKLNHPKIGDCLYSSLKARGNSLLFHKNVESNFEWVSS